MYKDSYAWAKIGYKTRTVKVSPNLKAPKEAVQRVREFHSAKLQIKQREVWKVQHKKLGMHLRRAYQRRRLLLETQGGKNLQEDVKDWAEEHSEKVFRLPGILSSEQ